MRSFDKCSLPVYYFWRHNTLLLPFHILRTFSFYSSLNTLATLKDTKNPAVFNSCQTVHSLRILLHDEFLQHIMLPSLSTWSITSCDISIKWTAANGFVRGHVGVVLMMTGQLDSQRVRPRSSCHFSLHLGGSSTTAHLTIAAANTSSISHTLLRWCENQSVYTCITGMHITTGRCLLRSYKQHVFTQFMPSICVVIYTDASLHDIWIHIRYQKNFLYFYFTTVFQIWLFMTTVVNRHVKNKQICVMMT